MNISVEALLKREIQNNPENGKIISKCIDSGEAVPDNIVNSLIENRLKQSDCKVNGWVMDGFPTTEPQINLLKALRIKPSVVFLFEQSEDESIRRLGNRRIDPHTGIFYNLEVSPPSDEATSNRLIESKADNYNVVKARHEAWSKKV